jgi:tetratricopeptide (TPR) repeat protein
MIDELLASVAQLRSNAQDLRRKGRDESDPEKGTALLDAAAEEFKKAITVLERGLRTLRRRRQAGYSREVCRVLEALSQSYGSLGGTCRDAGDRTQARDYYDKGDAYEKERRSKCDAKDTYNMLQRLIIRLLIEPTLLGQSSFVADLHNVREEIERQVRSGRNDSWALADLALVQFLCGADADAVIGDLEKGQAEATFYESTFNAVKALVKEGLGKGERLGERLEAFQRLLQRKGGLA